MKNRQKMVHLYHEMAKKMLMLQKVICFFIKNIITFESSYYYQTYNKF